MDKVEKSGYPGGQSIIRTMLGLGSETGSDRFGDYGLTPRSEGMIEITGEEAMEQHLGRGGELLGKAENKLG